MIVRTLSCCRTAIALLMLGITGCASLPHLEAKTPERAFAAPESTALGRAVTSAAPSPDLAGLRLLESGEDAYAALSALIGRAQKSLDLQYYIVRDDTSSRTLLRGVIEAAARGVRVRLLVDDFNTVGEETALRCLARQPGVQVRLFNPFPAGRFSTVTRIVASARDMRRISARMHNKQLIADNAAAVTGGRNLGDAYFVKDAQANFLDLDLFVAGPVVRKLSQTFDAFWNDELAFPIETLHDAPPDAATCERDAAEKDAAVADKQASLEKTPPPPRPMAPAVALDGKLNLTWAPAELLVDAPEKVQSEGQPTPDVTVADDVERLLAGARREVLVISPYFVPGARGMKVFEDLRRRGVSVRVLTNSLAATDAPAVHLGYGRYRLPLLSAGVALYELRPQLGSPQSGVGNFGSSRSSLHAKALVIDRSVVLVGSMNMDPRSANVNSEMGLIVRSPRIAAQVADLFADVASHSSYAVTSPDGERLRWTSEEDGQRTVHDAEPEAGVGRRALLWLIAPFAPESML